MTVIKREEILVAAALLVLLLVVYLVYRPGLTGPLLLDDFWNLRPLGEEGGVNNLSNLRQFLFNNNSGPTGRPVSMASFLLDAQDWPPLVASMKHTNIMLHLLCGTVLFWFVLQLSQMLGMNRLHSSHIALLVVGIWLLHPLNTSTVLYIVQRMTQLMTLFALSALGFYLAGRRLLEDNPRKAAISLCLALFPFGLLSVLSKENGALLLALIVLMEFLFFRHRQTTAFFRWWFRLGVLLPVAIVILYLMYSLPENLAMYDIRNFSLGERLLTETRVLVTYLWKILIPNVLGNSLFHDDLAISTSLINPLTTVFCAAILLALIASAIYWNKQAPVFSFAVYWFFVLHLLESSYIPLELYFEHRNYFPMIGPLFAIAWYLRRYLSAHQETHLKQTLVIVLAFILATSSWLTWTTADTWGNALRLHSAWAEEKPRSIRAQTTYADYLNVLGLHDVAMERLELAHSYYPDEVTIQLFMWNQACEYGLEKPHTLESIANNPQLEYYRDDVNQHLQILIENMMVGVCDYPDQQILISLFERIGMLPLPGPRRASYHVFFSDLYVFFGMLNPALINLTQSFELNPAPQLPVRQAMLSASAGNYSDALIFLERAREAENSNNPLLPSIEDEIDRLERDFSERL
ncbi:MAG: hypothetical protein MI746_14075 [Pseudomonadales bacterium]|nr:hypothetical protein [Pseudomonadales bacterium]